MGTANRRGRKAVRRTSWVVPGAILAGLVVIVAAFLLIRWYTTPLPPPAPSSQATQQVVATITTLPASEFDAVGTGSASNSIKPITGTPLTGSTGKPEVLYIGAEFCPYCAAERWPLIIALSRFGTFSGLQTSTSSSTDVFPNTPTFTFRSSTYTSQYLDFRAVETSDRNGNPLQSPTPAEQQLFNRYDTGGSIPFVDMVNRYSLVGATYSPNVLTGMSWQAIATSLQDPATPQSLAILGSANLFTAAICKASSNQPGTVCSSAAIQAIEQQLG
jgi:thiol-disulfide isomerase/thioredoxin